MLVSEFIDRVNYVLRATEDDAPTESSDEWTYWIDTLNRKKDELFEDVTKQWRFSFKETAPNEPGTVATSATTTLTGTSTNFTDYQVGDKLTVSGETERTIATITSDTVLTVTVAFSNTASGKTFTHKSIIASADQSYSLHRNFLAPSDSAYVTDTSSNRLYFEIIQPQERDYYTQQVYISGDQPQVLTFTSTIESTDSLVGGTLTVPGYYMPDDVDANSDSVPLPDPDWGVMAVASEIAFNDITYEDKAPDLQVKANALFSQMVARNRRGTYRNPRKSAYNVRRIPGTDVR